MQPTSHSDSELAPSTPGATAAPAASSPQAPTPLPLPTQAYSSFHSPSRLLYGFDATWLSTGGESDSALLLDTPAAANLAAHSSRTHAILLGATHNRADAGETAGVAVGPMDMPMFGGGHTNAGLLPASGGPPSVAPAHALRRATRRKIVPQHLGAIEAPAPAMEDSEGGLPTAFTSRAAGLAVAPLDAEAQLQALSAPNFGFISPLHPTIPPASYTPFTGQRNLSPSPSRRTARTPFDPLDIQSHSPAHQYGGHPMSVYARAREEKRMRTQQAQEEASKALSGQATLPPDYLRVLEESARAAAAARVQANVASNAFASNYRGAAAATAAATSSSRKTAAVSVGASSSSSGGLFSGLTPSAVSASTWSTFSFANAFSSVKASGESQTAPAMASSSNAPTATELARRELLEMERITRESIEALQPQTRVDESGEDSRLTEGQEDVAMADDVPAAAAASSSSHHDLPPLPALPTLLSPLKSVFLRDEPGRAASILHATTPAAAAPLALSDASPRKVLPASMTISGSPEKPLLPLARPYLGSAAGAAPPTSLLGALDQSASPAARTNPLPLLQTPVNVHKRGRGRPHSAPDAAGGATATSEAAPSGGDSSRKRKAQSDSKGGDARASKHPRKASARASAISRTGSGSSSGGGSDEDSSCFVGSGVKSARSSTSAASGVPSAESLLRVKKRSVRAMLDQAEVITSTSIDPTSSSVGAASAGAPTVASAAPVGLTDNQRIQLRAQAQLHIQLLGQTAWLCSVLPPGPTRTPSGHTAHPSIQVPNAPVVGRMRKHRADHAEVARKARELMEEWRTAATATTGATGTNNVEQGQDEAASQRSTPTETMTPVPEADPLSQSSEHDDVARIILGLAESAASPQPASTAPLEEGSSKKKRRTTDAGGQATSVEPEAAAAAAAEGEFAATPFGFERPLDLAKLPTLPILNVPALGLCTDESFTSLPLIPTPAMLAIASATAPPLEEDKENASPIATTAAAAGYTKTSAGRALLRLPAATVKAFWEALVPKYHLDAKYLPKLLPHERHLFTASEEHLFTLALRQTRISLAMPTPIELAHADHLKHEMAKLQYVRRRYLPAKTIQELNDRLFRMRKKEEHAKEVAAMRANQQQAATSTMMHPGEVVPIPASLEAAMSGSPAAAAAMPQSHEPVTVLRGLTASELTLCIAGWREYHASRSKWSAISEKYLPWWPRKLLAKAWTKYQGQVVRQAASASAAAAAAPTADTPGADQQKNKPGRPKGSIKRTAPAAGVAPSTAKPKKTTEKEQMVDEDESEVAASPATQVTPSAGALASTAHSFTSPALRPLRSEKPLQRQLEFASMNEHMDEENEGVDVPAMFIQQPQPAYLTTSPPQGTAAATLPAGMALFTPPKPTSLFHHAA